MSEGMFKAWDIHQTFSENNQRTSHKGKEQYHVSFHASQIWTSIRHFI
ncbi:hypothetical protein C360_04078 [Cryptococcus neoformans Bt15]|nr:hypothetical protein C360_04078 [Cryptococcus neoformans var. grubii Bt15]